LRLHNGDKAVWCTANDIIDSYLLEVTGLFGPITVAKATPRRNSENTTAAPPPLPLHFISELPLLA
jgi:hypothetical protein